MFPKIPLSGVQDKEASFRIRQILYGIRILFFESVLKSADPAQDPDPDHAHLSAIVYIIFLNTPLPLMLLRFYSAL